MQNQNTTATVDVRCVEGNRSDIRNDVTVIVDRLLNDPSSVGQPLRYHLASAIELLVGGAR